MKQVALAVVCLMVSVIGYGQPNNDAYVILLSFDGFRYDYVDRYDVPNFRKLRESGSHATGLIPSFPSKTFPNHYSIVTGLYPGHHGLVDNTFYDPERGTLYELSDRILVKDEYYYGGTPIWKLAKDHGLKTASYFWVGSEVIKEEQRPDYAFDYDEHVPDTLRINQAIRWLKLPENERPRLITLYFPFPDQESHNFGVQSSENERAVMRCDSLLGILMKKMKTLDLAINLVVVSDHGMRDIKRKPSTYIFLPEILNIEAPDIQVANGGTHTHIYVRDESKKDSVYNVLKKANRKFSVYKQEDYPEQWHYQHPRSGDLLIAANPGKYIISSDRKEYVRSIKLGTSFGVHGYDPDADDSMMGIFFAAGPNIAKGRTLPPFRNIHIYPLIAQLLNLPLPEIDGDPKVLEGIVR